MLPTELLLQYMFTRANYCLYTDRIINEGKNLTNYMLLKESQNISISFFSWKKYYLDHAPFSQSLNWHWAMGIDKSTKNTVVSL